MEIIKGKDGLKFKVLNKNDFIARYIKDKGEYEPELKQATEALIADKRGVIVDVGANIGTYCIPLAKKYPGHKIVAFEVQEKIFGILKENLAINRVHNIQAIHGGLSDRKEEITASIPDYKSETNIGAFSLDADVRQHDYEVHTNGGQETFSLMPLDDYKLKNVILIKIDVEGMELSVLRGAEKTIVASNYPPIIFEAWADKEFFKPRRDELFHYLQNMGYEITEVVNNNFAQHKSRSDTLQLRFKVISPA